MRYVSVLGFVAIAASFGVVGFAQQSPVTPPAEAGGSKVAKPDLPVIPSGPLNPASGDVPSVLQPKAITVPKPIGAVAGSTPVQAPPDPNAKAAPEPVKKAVLPISVIPDELKTKAAVANQHVRANQPKEALTQFTEMLAAKPDLFTIAVERGKVYQSLKDHPKAIADFTSAITAQADHFEAYFRRCVSFHDTGAFAQAVADCTKAIALNPQPAEYHLYRGLAHTAMRTWDKAAADLAAATERNNEQPDAHLQLARVYAEMDQLVAALREYTIALQQRPGYPEAYQGRSIVKAALGDAVGSKEDAAKIAR